MKKYPAPALSGLIVALCLGLLGTHPAVAGTPTVYLTVDTTTDSHINSGCSDGVDDDDCSLRGAIDLANGTPGTRHVITIPAGTYVLNIDPTPDSEDLNVEGDLDIANHSIELDGAGMGVTIIDGNHNDRVIDHLANTTPRLLELVGLTIRNGTLETGAGGGAGVRGAPGGWLNLSLVELSGNIANGLDTTWDTGGGLHLGASGTANLYDSLVQGNQACSGGGVKAFNNTLNILDSTFTDNHAICTLGKGGAVDIREGGTITIGLSRFIQNSSAFLGGALDLDNINPVTASLDITDTTFDGNSAQVGGALELYESTTMERVTFSNNHAEIYGGAVVVWETLEMQNVTLSGNDAISQGGALYVSNPSGLVNLDHVTITGNSVVISGGEALLATVNSHLTITNSILASPEDGHSTCYIEPGANITDPGFNLSSDFSCLTAPGDQVASDPRLAPLGSYGGLTQTVRLLPGSPAIDQGDPADWPDWTDQRGMSIYNSRSDIGAFEYQFTLFDWFPVILR